MRSTPVMQINENSERHQTEEVSVQVMYKKIRPVNKKAEIGASPLGIRTGKRHLILWLFWRRERELFLP